MSMEKVPLYIYKPKWLRGKLVLAMLFIAAACVGGYFWGMWSVDVDLAIDEFLAGEPNEMRQGRYAGYAVAVVGNETISTNWLTFCGSVVEECRTILEEQVR